MKKHTRVYTQFFGYGEQDYVPCEICGKQAIDVHHITYKSQGGKDEINNLIGLCRQHHDQGHFKTKPYLTKEYLQERHNKFLKQFDKTRKLS